jgi:hypothetical protein
MCPTLAESRLTLVVPAMQLDPPPQSRYETTTAAWPGVAAANDAEQASAKYLIFITKLLVQRRLS